MTQSNVPSTQAVQLPSAWSANTIGIENRRKAQQNLSLKHGMFASVPIICKGRKCPYFETCWIPEPDLQVGDRCPIEIAAVLERFDVYCESLGINPELREDAVDASIVKEIVDIEIMMLRADSLLATSGNMIQEVVAGVTPKGQEYYKPELHKAVEFKDNLRKEKTRLLNQLNATRKDKKDTGTGASDPSSVAARIIAKVKDLEKQGKIIDVTPDEDIIEGEIVETPQEEVNE